MSSEAPEGGEREHPSVAPEAEQLPRGLILRTVLTTVMVGAGLCFGTYLFLRERLMTLRPAFRFPEGALSAPHEVANVRQEVFGIAHPVPSVRERQRAALERFEWVDRRRRIVHIPIEAAMDLVARESAPGGGSR
jgi:hypothetical protein